MPNPTREHTKKAYAAQLGVSLRTLSRWLNEGAPRNEDGSLDVDAIRAWRSDRPSARVAAADPEKVAAATERRRSREAETAQGRKDAARLRRARADLLELQVAEKKGEIISLAEHKAVLVARARALRLRYRTLPHRIVRRLQGQSPAKQVDIIRDILDEDLRDIVSTRTMFPRRDR